MSERPRLRDDAETRLDELVTDIQRAIDNRELSGSRFIGRKGDVTEDRVIYHALGKLRAEFDRGELDL